MPGDWYSYAIAQVVLRVERGECINVGVVLFVSERNGSGAQRFAVTSSTE